MANERLSLILRTYKTTSNKALQYPQLKTEYAKTSTNRNMTTFSQ